MTRAEMIAALERRDDVYALGYVEGLSAYAWWKDGTEYVGTTGTTLTQAIETFLRERQVIA